MIKAVLIINSHGTPRLARFYAQLSTEKQQQLMKAAHEAVSQRGPGAVNIIEDASRFGKNIKLVYRAFATLFFIFLVDRAENELAILDLIQIFVEALDRCYKNVCELDLVFNFTTIQQVLNEVVLGGQAMEVTPDEVARMIQELQRLERRPDPPPTAVRLRGSPLLR